MSRVDAAAPDRLPWLEDEPAQQKAARARGARWVWAMPALAAIAGGAFWMGTRTADERSATSSRVPATTIQLPTPHSVEPSVLIPPQPQVQPVLVPVVRPAPAREVRLAAPAAERSERRVAGKAVAVPEPQAKPTAAPAPPPVTAAPTYVPSRPWNPRVAAGAAGRLVQVGAFGSIRQAKRGWWFMVRAYPAMSSLPAVVRPSRNSRGRVFYRFQVGTTSQAHSEVLCQRMRTIRLSCAVVGLPWKAKVER